MPIDLHKTLKTKFGYEAFHGGQQEIIEAVLEGKDVIGILPTGMGKSLCYQMPAYLLPHTVIVISPLVSLMQDQVEQLRILGEKRVIALNSFLTPKEKRNLLTHASDYKFIFISPEMLMQEQVRTELQSIPISLIVADEAHCISQWGYDFRPDYLRFGEWLRNWERPPILALTATATDNVISDIEQFLHLKNPSPIIQSLDRPNIRYSAVQVESNEEKFWNILNQIQTYEGPGIIYTQSRKKADEYSMKLNDAGIRVAPYHAGMEQMDRTFVQQQFLQGEIDWVCATNAFGMGVHKSDIRQIIHDHIPSSVANYAQEIGRAGRDGENAVATLMFSERDDQMTVFVATNDFPDITQVHLFTNHNNPKQLVDEGMLSETSYRILSYWLERSSIDETIQTLAKLKQEKLNQIQLMKELISNNSCKRKQLVEFFGQQLISTPMNCCSNCGLNEEEVLKRPSLLQVSDKELNWKNRLSLIFPDRD
ncbi:MAG: ATP-dependent DNA helicase RecQ [Paenisporosarcina sp.]